MKKQTAVEWLEQQFNNTFYVAEFGEMGKRFTKIFEQAKEMEREQMLKLISFIRMHNKMGKSADDLLQEFETYKGVEQ